MRMSKEYIRDTNETKVQVINMICKYIGLKCFYLNIPRVYELVLWLNSWMNFDLFLNFLIGAFK